VPLADDVVACLWVTTSSDVRIDLTCPVGSLTWPSLTASAWQALSSARAQSNPPVFQEDRGQVLIPPAVDVMRSAMDVVFGR
jgi:hypothetical protein